ncbi:MAG TPA: aminotransferase class I/II-fold pyridoxal phosphate-dependent enzyme [Acidimicrobiales bacterium]|nr:aminotransferase class I/II-fold pyridoxal phosphate-dependent enzyme [Acidimicrobiales bacterium]
MTAAFEPPPTVWEAIDGRRGRAGAHPGGAIDLTIGTPVDDPPGFVADVLARAGGARGYPPSVGTARFRTAAAGWVARRFGVEVPPEQVAASMGSKELVAGLPHWLRLRRPDRDTVLHPAVAYPTYAMGARLAGCRAVPVPAGPDGALDLAAVDPADAARALGLWSNSPGNPTGALDDLAAAAAWGRAHDVPVLSDECYTELTWDGPPRTILAHGLDGVLAVHSLSKRSNLAGLRVGFYAGDAELVAYLSQLRKHAGCMVAGPVQEVAAVALDDDGHAAAQRATYRRRLDVVRAALGSAGLPAPEPGGAFYLWLPAPGGDGAAWADWWADELGTLVTPGGAYGPAGEGHVRLALVAPDDRVDELARRLAARAGAASGPAA